MDREISFRGKRLDNGEWVYGSLIQMDNVGSQSFIFPFYKYASSQTCGQIVSTLMVAVDPATIGWYIKLGDKNGVKIFKGDITELILPSGEIRHFIVDIRTVTRTVVSHPYFDDATSKVEITGVVFLWNGYELFPNVNSEGVSDISRMKVVGNIYDNPNLIEEKL